MDILIIGTGALATLFAARLSHAGHAVTLLGAWQQGLDALREHGARLVMADGREEASPVQATDQPSQVRGAKYAIVLSKSWGTERAARFLSECLAKDGLALTLQNGLGNREKLSVLLGAERVALGTTTTGATLLGPGRVRAGGEGVISLEAHRALGPLEEALRSAGFQIEVVENAASIVWSKLVINAAINPLTALLRMSNGELIEWPSARVLMGALAEEAAAVARAKGVKLNFDDPVAAVERIARQTKTNRSSMLQDVERGARTEIDAICGEIVRLGEQHGIPTPANRACWELVHALAE